MKYRGAIALFATSMAGVLVLGGHFRARAQFAGNGPVSFAPLVARVAPEVVGIVVSEGRGGPRIPMPQPPGPRDAPLGRPSPPERDDAVVAAGSGFIIDPAGYIVTNDHVVGGADRITVTLDDGSRFPARLVGSDQLTDLAVVKIDARRRLTAAVWGDSGRMRVGDWILAGGNPFALGNSYTAGIISAEGRDIGDGPFDHFLQLDAPINPGNSGGPSFDLAGEVVGVNTAIVSPSGGSVGIGFAIPSDTARRIVAAIIAHGGIARGWLGISVGDSDTAGAVITGIEPGGPADRGGLAVDDAVIAVDGRAVDGADALIRAIASVAPGSAVHLTVLRNGRTLDLQVVVGRRPAQIGN